MSASQLATPQKTNSLFPWPPFYQAIAQALLAYQPDRAPLVQFLHRLAQQVPVMTPLQDQFLNGSRGPLQDICPFTVLGSFNRGISEANRRQIAQALADFLGVDEPVPASFLGVPILNNQRSWFFGFALHRKSGDIDQLWLLFEKALALADTPTTANAQTPETARLLNEFMQAYDQALHIYATGWNLSIGLYWLAPYYYPTLDSCSRSYISQQLGITVAYDSQPKRIISAAAYLQLQQTLLHHFQTPQATVKSLPELSYRAWLQQQDGQLEQPSLENESGLNFPLEPFSKPLTPPTPYLISDLMAEGCFVEQGTVEKLLERLTTKKNLILQGAPGTGKTWLAKRLAYALVGYKTDVFIKVIQFHPSLAYEDFVRGWRPNEQGGLSLVDGPFLTLVRQAQENPDTPHVFVIEEINRGNPAQLFGDLLTLLETDKRGREHSLTLSYRHHADESFYLPANLYLIGTMNLADRSLAFLDFALRRRFAFMELLPQFGTPWQTWLQQSGLPATIVQRLAQTLNTLNQNLAQEAQLGRGCQIGHSYFTPAAQQIIGNPRAWYEAIIDTEIVPLLQEYWFDAPAKVSQARHQLLSVWD